MSWKELWDKAKDWYNENEDRILDVTTGILIGEAIIMLCDAAVNRKLDKNGYLRVKVGNGVGKSAAATKHVIDTMNSAASSVSHIRGNVDKTYALKDLGKFGDDLLQQARELGIPGVDPENMIQYVLTGFGKK